MTFIRIQQDDIHRHPPGWHLPTFKEDIHRHPTMDREWNLIMDEKDIRNVVVFLYLFGILCCCRGAERGCRRPSFTLSLTQHALDLATRSWFCFCFCIFGPVEVDKVVAPAFLGKFWTPGRERERPKKEAVSGGGSFRLVWAFGKRRSRGKTLKGQEGASFIESV